jgi:transposase InsO family protein
MIEQLRLQYEVSVPFLCQFMEVSPSGFYSWRKREPSKHSREEARLEVEILAAHKRTRMKISMSRKGNCYDNAPMESFWGVLKNELIYHCRYRTRQEAINDIREYIEVFYNRQRKQAKLGYLSPAVYEKKFYEERKAA